MNRKQAVLKSLINSVSSSLSVYHGPPVSATEGSRCAIIYILLLGAYNINLSIIACVRDRPLPAQSEHALSAASLLMS